jgi:hypothetical protein
MKSRSPEALDTDIVARYNAKALAQIPDLPARKGDVTARCPGSSGCLRMQVLLHLRPTN